MSRPRRAPAIALVLAIAGLAGCGGGGTATSSSTTTTTGGTSATTTPGATTTPVATPAPAPATVGDKLAVGTGCFSYTLTASPVLTGADPLLAQQWHLRNTGTNTAAPGAVAGQDLNAFPAWVQTRGEGVRLVVIDDSIEITHPDLRPNLVEGASKSYRVGNPGGTWPLPCNVNDDNESHGTSVAGLAVARDGNAIGGSGVAPRASLVAFDALVNSADADISEALQRDGALNAVYHNSWGSPDNAKLNASDASFRTAIRQGVDTGRAGKGSIYVFSAGNGQQSNDNSNYDGYVNVLGTNAVCAVDQRGRQSSYSEPGANLLVCAPSSGSISNVATTTLNGGYRTDFSGTSASAPMVSGVAALMLSANPALTWRDVRLILARTSRQVETADTATLSNPTAWAPSALGGTVRFHHKYGYGVVDANAAVTAAKTWSSVGGSSTLRSCTLDSGTLTAPIPDATGPTNASTPGTPVTQNLTFSACAITSIEWVEIRVTIDGGYSGDFRIDLTRPWNNGGTTVTSTSRLADMRACQKTSVADTNPCGPYSNWLFGSARHLGEPGNGTWTLSVTDMNATDVGTLKNWSITLYGQ
ncbi:MAG: S8 family serine peptidase [Burkholderiales bacterium]